MVRGVGSGDGVGVAVMEGVGVMDGLEKDAMDHLVAR